MNKSLRILFSLIKSIIEFILIGTISLAIGIIVFIGASIAYSVNNIIEYIRKQF